jgi:hypothetical protein
VAHKLRLLKRLVVAISKLSTACKTHHSNYRPLPSSLKITHFSSLAPQQGYCVRRTHAYPNHHHMKLIFTSAIYLNTFPCHSIFTFSWVIERRQSGSLSNLNSILQTFLQLQRRRFGGFLRYCRYIGEDPESEMRQETDIEA